MQWRDVNVVRTDWPDPFGTANLVVVGGLGLVGPRVVPQDLHDGEVSEVGHVGDLGQGLEDAPGEEPGLQFNRHFSLPRIRPRTLPKSFLDF